MDRERNRFRWSLYRSVVFYAFADAVIVFFLCAVVFMLAYGVISRAWGMRTDVAITLEYVIIAVAVAAGLRAARNTTRACIAAYRRDRGECVHCGYDLRASHDCCPECGRPIRAARYGGRE